jgi:ketosteroid isomerase-like protein
MEQVDLMMKWFGKWCAVGVAMCGLLVPAFAQEQAAAGLGATGQQPPEIQSFQNLEDQWSEAEVKPDQYGMELLLSPYFVDISSAGEVQTRNQLIATMFEKGGPRLLSMEQKVASVRVFGDTAVVSGTYIVHVQVNYDPREERGIFTHVYERTRAGWLCVNSQRTMVADESLTKTKKPKAPKKKSTAELPFHIPLIHHGDQPAAQPQQ